MRLTKTQKTEALNHLKVLGMDLQPELFTHNEDQIVAKQILQFLSTLRFRTLKAKIAIRRVERECQAIIKKGPT